MKKLLVLLLTLVVALGCFASCEYLPSEITDVIDPVLDKIGLGTPEEPEVPDEPDTPDAPHVHEFVITEEKEGNCGKGPITVYTCSCGETKEEVGEPLGHDFRVASQTTATCIKGGGTKYKCKRCGFTKTDSTPATGHNYADFVEASRLMPCQNPNCSYALLADGNGKYDEILSYTFTDEDVARFDTIFAELGAIIEAAADYDETLHAYEPGSDVEAAYLIMEAKYDELYAVLEFATAQYQIAQLDYYVAMNLAERKEIYDYIGQVRTDLIAKFYSYSEDIYYSMFREYYYYGMTESEILAFIFDSNAVSNPEYKELVDRNNAIELEFLESTDEQVPILYSEFVANNKRIAEIMGYSNYLEYAYESVYSRDYSYTDIENIYGYTKKYVSRAFNASYSKWNSIIGENLSDTAYADYNTYILESFFSDYTSNKQLNDYIDLLAFTSNPDKQISFSDSLNGLMSDGNLFRGQYSGAYVTKIYGHDIPVAYFGYDYSDSFTVAHEFGHYMNEIYNELDYVQSFDLLEMHSQGNELLFLAYLMNLEGVLYDDGKELVETYMLINMLSTVMNSVAVDAFERAVYTDTYNGLNSDVIMADGLITYDEYDLLYESIIQELGGGSNMDARYWRYVTILSPCYYISYAISALSVLQLYPMANEDFDGAVESYLKLFTYIDTYDETTAVLMTTEEILLYAGLYSFTDEELYKLIAAGIAN